MLSLGKQLESLNTAKDEKAPEKALKLPAERVRSHFGSSHCGSSPSSLVLVAPSLARVMVVVEDVLTDCLGACIREWFEPNLNHPFMNLHTICVPDDVKPLPKRCIEDVEVQIDEGFGCEENDVLGQGPITSWTPEEGRQRLRDAMKRLDLSEEHVAHPNLHKMSRHEFASEKRLVKQEFKRYDAEFRKQFMRLPSHLEKEPMRPLYVYYREGRRATNVEVRIATLEARIESLQGEKASVRAKLQAFQEKFVTENSRKIRFHKDILPIEREYRMYKHLKEEIMKVEAQLRDLKAES